MMNQRYLSFLLATAFFFLVTTFPFFSISATEILVSNELQTEYLLSMSFVSPDPAEIPPGLTPDQATDYARVLTYQHAQPLIAELTRMISEGTLTEFEIRPDLYGILVKGVMPDDLERFSFLQGIAGIVKSEENVPDSCGMATARALSDQIAGLSQAHAIQADMVQSTSIIQATNPGITAYAPPGSTWTYVYGQANPNTTVTLRILRSGQTIATQTTVSYNDGMYYFYPYWNSCPVSGYTWALRAGDVIEVTAQGRTASTTVAPVSVWIDPVANTVAGNTTAGRSVHLMVYTPVQNQCTSTVQEREVGTDSRGNFTIGFTNLTRRTNALVRVADSNGNSTIAYFYAYQINTGFDSSYFSGYLKPDTAFTATLRRGGNPVSTYTGTSSAGGYYFGYFSHTVQGGDLITVSGGGITIQYTATNLIMNLDHVNDRITGTTSAGRQITAYFYKNADSGNVRTSCSWNSRCNAATANSAGSFTVPAMLDLVRGDYAYVYVYDAEGNYQYTGGRYVPVIVADVESQYVRGYWQVPYVDLTVILKNSSGTVKAQSYTWASWGGWFSVWLNAVILPTDRIEVTDGTVTETMSVQNLTARLNSNTGNLSGIAPNSRLIATFWDFRRSGGYYNYCQEMIVAGSAYTLVFGGVQAGAQDQASVVSTGADGHYTARSAKAFGINARKESNYFWGYTETPNTPVSVSLRVGNTMKAGINLVSSSSGYYYGYFTNNSAPVNIVQGDSIQVQTGDGGNATLQIPELTVNTGSGSGTNRVYGKSPVNQPVRPGIRRWFNGGYYMYTFYMQADGGGNYNVGLNGLYWGRNCSAVEAQGRCTQAAVSYYTPADHQIWMEGAMPPSVSADAYENNNTAATATLYTGIQNHTFHSSDDVDWIRFHVSDADIARGAAYHISTFNLGWGMATEVVLYDAGMNPLRNWPGYEYQGRGVYGIWTPQQSGTYYLKISPPGSHYAAYCDARYSLLILAVREQIYLPLITR